MGTSVVLVSNRPTLLASNRGLSSVVWSATPAVASVFYGAADVTTATGTEITADATGTGVLAPGEKVYAVSNGDVATSVVTAVAAGTDPAALASVNAQTGTTYTLTMADAGGVVTCTNGSAVTVTVPPNADVAFPIGTRIQVAQLGAGATSVAAGSGVTVTGAGNMGGQYGAKTLTKTATNTWILTA
jgi:hypothetical protein